MQRHGLLLVENLKEMQSRTEGQRERRVNIYRRNQLSLLGVNAVDVTAISGGYELPSRYDDTR